MSEGGVLADANFESSKTLISKGISRPTKITSNYVPYSDKAQFEVSTEQDQDRPLGHSDATTVLREPKLSELNLVSNSLGTFLRRELCRKAHIMGAALKVDSEDLHRLRRENRRE